MNEYHDKAFAAQTDEENGGASSYARGGSGSSKTLEQETVDQLTEAGYAAYIVTADNYDTVSETLNTDLADMGLNPDSSYIVVVSGEPSQSQGNSNARIVGPPTHEDFDGDGTLAFFTYIQGDKTYSMRFITVTAADYENELYVSQNFMLSDIDNIEEIFEVLVEYALTAACEKAVEELLEDSVELIPYVGDICTVISLFADVYNAATTNPLTLVEPDTLFLFSGTAWTHRYIQVYNSETNYWHTAQRSSYAFSKAHFDSGYIYNPETNQPEEFEIVVQNITIYSPYYNSPSQYKSRAVEGYLRGRICPDYTGDIDFYFTNPNATIAERREIFLFTHKESTTQLITDREEG